MIQIQNVSKIYKTGEEQTLALKDVSLTINDNEFIVFVGSSGSGKSTLLSLIGGLDKPTEGKILVDGENLEIMKDKELSAYRSKKIGFIFQDFHLQPHLTLLENVELPHLFVPSKKAKGPSITKKAKELLTLVELKNRMDHKPGAVSGGQKQRAAIARALINNPSIILADEPTGNLDSVTAKGILDLLRHLHKKENMTIIVVTHDQTIAKSADRIIEIKDGSIVT